MTGIQRQCKCCGAWKGPVHFRLRLRKGVRFTRGCRECVSGRRSGASVRAAA